MCSRLLLSAALVVVMAATAVFTAGPSAATMATAANAFLNSLNAEQKQKVQFPFDDTERVRWHFIPNEQFPRHGLMIKDMTPPQRDAAHTLLKSGLSPHGYMTVTSIMDLETVLRSLETGRFARNPQEYLFSIFGTPVAKGTWGWRVEGHHVSLHFTIVNGELTVSAPSFLGANPAEVRTGPKAGLRLLGFEEDPARALVTSLSAQQRAKAILPVETPGDVVTANKFPVEPLAPSGILASELTTAERDTLMTVIQAYISQMNAEIGTLRMNRLKESGLGKIGFAWAGDVERGKKHYYRVQGPTFLIEYDNTQNDANHVHSVWRDFSGDFGQDLLREHLRGVAH